MNTLLILLCMGLLNPILNGCVAHNNGCDINDPHCHPDVAAGDQKIAKIVHFEPDKLACPDYQDKLTCCNQDTMDALFNNFDLIDRELGDPSNGCSICATNMKRFWCLFNCSPDQDQIIDPASAKIVENYNDPGGAGLLDVLSVDAGVDVDYTCGVYKSCKNVYFVKELGSMSSPQGFFNSMASKGVSNGHMVINFKYIQKGIKGTAYSCDNIFTKRDAKGNIVDPSGYKLFENQGWCSCSNCSYNCTDINFQKYIKPQEVTEGFSSTTFIQVSVVCLAVLLVVLGRRFSRDTKKEEEESIERAVGRNRTLAVSQEDSDFSEEGLKERLIA